MCLRNLVFTLTLLEDSKSNYADLNDDFSEGRLSEKLYKEALVLNKHRTIEALALVHPVVMEA